MISALSLAILLASPQAEPSVTFSAPAMTARNLFPALSKAAGVLIRTGVYTNDEVLLIDVKDVPLSKLLDKIAAVTGSEWTKEPGVYTLVRSTNLARSQEAAVLDERTAALQKEIDRLMEPVTKAPKLDAATINRLAQENRVAKDRFNEQIRNGANGGGLAIMVPPSSPTPASRALARVIASIQAKALAEIPAGSRVVYATTPTTVQRAMPSDGAKAMATFLDEHNTWVANTGPEPERPANENFQVRIIGAGGSDAPKKKINGLLGKTHLIVTRTGTSGGILVELNAYDREGLRVGHAEANLSPAPSLPTATVGDDKPVKLDDDALNIAKALCNTPGQIMRGSISGGGGVTISVVGTSINGAPENPAEKVELTKAQRAKLLNPVANDPASLVAGPALDAAASGTNVVASIPDSALMPLCRAVIRGNVTSKSVFSALVSGGMVVEQKDGWTTGQARLPFLARAGQVSRPALAALLGAMERNKHLGLTEFAAYAMSRSLPTPAPAIDEQTLAALNSEVWQSYRFEAIPNWRAMKLYGGLTQSQRQALDRGAPLAVGNLSREQWALADSLVFDDMIAPNISLPRGGGPSGPAGPGFEEALLNERTEALPNGMPRDSYLQAAGPVQGGVFASISDRPGSRFFTAREYGGHLAFNQTQGLAAPGMERVNYDRFRLGTVRTINLTLFLTPLVQTARTLRDASVLPDSKETGFEQLPADFQAAVKAAFEAAKANFNRGGGNNPPPPGGFGAPPPNN